MGKRALFLLAAVALPTAAGAQSLESHAFVFGRSVPSDRAKRPSIG